MAYGILTRMGLQLFNSRDLLKFLLSNLTVFNENGVLIKDSMRVSCGTQAGEIEEPHAKHAYDLISVIDYSGFSQMVIILVLSLICHLINGFYVMILVWRSLVSLSVAPMFCSIVVVNLVFEEFISWKVSIDPL